MRSKSDNFVKRNIELSGTFENTNFSLHLTMIGADEEPKLVNGKRVLKMSVQRKQRFFKTYFFVGFVVSDNSILIFTQLSGTFENTNVSLYFDQGCFTRWSQCEC